MIVFPVLTAIPRRGERYRHFLGQLEKCGKRRQNFERGSPRLPSGAPPIYQISYKERLDWAETRAYTILNTANKIPIVGIPKFSIEVVA